VLRIRKSRTIGVEVFDMRELNGFPSSSLTAVAALLLLAGCPSDDEAGTDDDVGSTESTGTGDGDGDPDTSSESADTTADTTADTDTSTTADTDTDTTADTDTDTDTTADTDTDTTADTDTDTTADTDTDTTTDTETDTESESETTDTGDPIVDTDEDGIPDDDDPFPMDPDLPGKAQGGFVYAHTSSQLYTMDVFNYDVALIGNFSFNQSAGQVTDLAIDRWGVVYVITFNDLFVCHPQTADCYYLGDLPQSFNGLTMVPPGVLDPDDDTLIGIANSGAWYKMTLIGQQVQLMQIGQYGGNMTSAGDVFSIDGEGTFGAVNKPGVNNGNVIVESDPLSGMVIAELATAVGYTTIYGLAGWEGIIFAFNSGGEIVSIDPADGTVTLIKDTPQSWWGAGVFTILPQ
jgi:hypothetical protein